MDHLGAARSAERPPTEGEAPADGLARELAHDLDAAFERLVRRELDRLFSIASRFLADERDAEEVVQDALVRAYRAIASYDLARIEALALRPWLAAIVVNLARNRRRRADALGRRQSTVPSNGHRPPASLAEGAFEPMATDPAGSPETVLLRREGAAGWAALLADLPARYRLPIVLRYVGDLSTPEVAAVLGRPEGTVRAQLHRGLERLRAAYLAMEQDTASERPVEEEAR